MKGVRRVQIPGSLTPSQRDIQQKNDEGEVKESSEGERKRFHGWGGPCCLLLRTFAASLTWPGICLHLRRGVDAL